MDKIILCFDGSDLNRHVIGSLLENRIYELETIAKKSQIDLDDMKEYHLLSCLYDDFCSQCERTSKKNAL